MSEMPEWVKLMNNNKVRFSQKDMANIMDDLFASCKSLREHGQKEYAHTYAFRNFDALAAKLDLDRKKVLLVYLEKHLDGITAYINGHRSQREPVSGRIKDAIVYLTLLHGMIIEEERNAPTIPPADCGPSA